MVRPEGARKEGGGGGGGGRGGGHQPTCGLTAWDATEPCTTSGTARVNVCGQVVRMGQRQHLQRKYTNDRAQG